jgi:hypothetical protein
MVLVDTRLHDPGAPARQRSGIDRKSCGRLTLDEPADPRRDDNFR